MPVGALGVFPGIAGMEYLYAFVILRAAFAHIMETKNSISAPTRYFFFSERTDRLPSAASSAFAVFFQHPFCFRRAYSYAGSSKRHLHTMPVAGANALCAKKALGHTGNFAFDQRLYAISRVDGGNSASTAKAAASLLSALIAFSDKR